MELEKIFDDALDTYSLDTVLLALQRACVNKASRIRQVEAERGQGLGTSRAWLGCATVVDVARVDVSSFDLELP